MPELFIREWGLDRKDRVASSVARFRKEDYPAASLEVGSGNGLFFTQIASARPDEFFFGIEKLIKCVNKAVKKIDNLRLSNTVLIYGDVFTAIERFFEPEFFNNIYINFPDPWVKKRDKKRCVIQDVTALKYMNYLKEGGRLYFVTDDREYRDDGIRSLIDAGFVPEFPAPHYADKIDDYPESLYEDKWRKEGREIFFSVFRKSGSK